MHPLKRLLAVGGDGTSISARVHDFWGNEIASSACKQLTPALCNAPFFELPLCSVLGQPLAVQDDVRIEVTWHEPGMLGVQSRVLFFLWVHCDMVRGNELSMGKASLDRLCQDTGHTLVEPQFKCTVVFALPEKHQSLRCASSSSGPAASLPEEYILVSVNLCSESSQQQSQHRRESLLTSSSSFTSLHE